MLMKNESDVQGVSRLGESLFLTFYFILLAMNNDVVILIIAYRISKTWADKVLSQLLLFLVTDISKET